MAEAPIALALAAGILAAVNPCGFALLPAYLALLVRGETGAPDPSPVAAVGRALAAAAAMTAGFAAVFGGFGLLAAPVAGQVQQRLPWLTIVLGLGVAAIGVWLLAGRTLTLPGIGRGPGPAVRRTWASMTMFGAAYAIASLGCTIAPFLATVVVTFRTGSLASGVAVFLAYATGMGLAVGAAALAVALSRSAAISTLRSWGTVITRASGGLLTLAGAYVAYYGWYEIRVFRSGSASDPVIDAAQTLQQALSTALGQLGPGRLAILVALLAGVTAAVAAVRARRRSRTNDNRPAPTTASMPKPGGKQ
jgi:cytochrome c-type biogenesis protein